MLDFMGWLRKQPFPIRRNSNPECTYSNKVGYVAIFLKEFGVSRLLKKKEYPRYHKKKVVAHPEDELSLLSTGMPMPKNDSCWTSSSAAWSVTTKDTDPDTPS